MQSTMGKFFKPLAGKTSRLELHDFLFEKERADEGKRLRKAEQAELGEWRVTALLLAFTRQKKIEDIHELVERDEERATRKRSEKRQAEDKERGAEMEFVSLRRDCSHRFGASLSEGRLKRHTSKTEGREIVPNLFLGGRLAAQNWEWLSANSIRTVVNVTADLSNYYEGEEGFVYHRIAIEDANGAEIGTHFEATTAAIRDQLEQGRAVLCHCREGLSRSPSIVVAFLMQTMNMPVEEALALVEQKNDMVRINKGFEAQLNQLNKQLFGQDSSLYNPKERAEKICYDDMTTAEKREYDAKMAKKNRKKPMSLQQFMELKSKQMREKKEAAAAAAAAESAAAKGASEPV